MRFRSLTTRFVLTLLLSTAVPFLVFGWFVRGGMRDRLEQQVVRVLLSDQAQLAAERLDALTDQVYRNCSLIGGAARRFFSTGDANSFEAELDLMLGFHRDFQHVLVAGEDGSVRVAVDTLSLDAQRRAARRVLAPRSVRDTEWFRATIEEDLGVYWVDRHLSPLLHRNPDRLSLDPNDYSLGFAFQVFGDSGERGVAYALVHWRRVQEIVDEVAVRLRADARFASAVVSLCDGRGIVIASSDRARYSARLAPSPLAAVVLSSFEGQRVVPYELDGDDFLAGTARVGGDAAREFDWRCVVAVPTSELFATSREFGQLLVAVTALAAGLLVVWSFFASRTILRPVRDLADATGRVAGGDLTVRVPVRGDDELAELGRSFNDMAEQLTDSQARLRDTAREAAWAEMARQVAHEIKNPLTPMRMSAQLLQRARAVDDVRVPELVDRLARTVLEQTDQLARIASDFRQFAGRPEPQFEELAADELLADVRELFGAVAETSAVRFDVQPGAGGVRIRADRGELRRVFVNLVQNAIAAVAEQGTVVVSSRPGELGAVEFAIRDDGPGVPSDVVARLFEPYFTTRSSGTGLGLAICRRIVEAHGGRIWLADGRPGATEFRFVIPGLARRATDPVPRPDESGNG